MATREWLFQNGTSGIDEISDAANGLNNTFVFVGSSSGNWGGTNAGSGDMIATKLDIQGDVLWKWQNGSSEGDSATGVAVGEDGSIVIGGNRQNSSTYVAVKLDADGTFVWQSEDDTGEVGELQDLAMWEDGSIILVGYTEGDWNGTHLGGGDFAAWKLNTNGSLAWRWQDGTEQQDIFHSVAVAKDGSAVLAGSSSGDWDGINFGLRDFAAVKIDSDGNELWRWQSGTNQQDTVYDVAIGMDGSMFLTGDTSGDWDGANKGKTDFIVIKLDADGKEMWRWQDGTGSYDSFRGILADTDGSVIVAGVSWSLWGNGNAGQGDFAAVKLDENGTQVWRWQGGSSEFERANAIVSSGSSSHVLVAGLTIGAWEVDGNVGETDFVAVLLDTGIEGTPEPTSTPVQTPSPIVGDLPPLAPTTEGVLTPIPSTDAPVSTRASSPTLVTDPPTATPPTPRLTFSPTLAAFGETPSSTTTTVVVVLSVVLFFIVMVGAGWLYRRRPRSQNDNAIPAPVQGWENGRVGAETTSSHGIPPPSDGVQSRQSAAVSYEGGVPSFHMRQKGTSAEAASLASPGDMTSVADAHKDKAVKASFEPTDPQGGLVGETYKGNYQRQRDSVTDPTLEDAELSSVEHGEAATAMYEPGASGTSPTGGCRTTVRGISIGHAVLAAAQEMAQLSHIPGVTEAAGLVIVLMNLVKDSSGLAGTADHMVNRCRSMVMLIRGAVSVFEEVGNNNGAANSPLIQDVRDAVGDLVQIIKTYQSKGRISQVLMSTLFKRRQEEAESVIHAAIGRLQLGLQVHFGHKMNKLEQAMGGIRLHPQEPEGSEPPSSSVVSLENRRIRRQRNLDKVEIPEDDVTVTDELLGKGGFGAVYIADYNGRNAAAKVVPIEHDLGRHEGGAKLMMGGVAQTKLKGDHDKVRRKVFWRELQAMISLRSPHTVHVYGAITSRQDRLVLVMELLPGGDLRAMLKHAQEPLAEEQARRIIRDIGTGMSFLHHKQTIHGDLKSPNVLLDGTGRAKIGDFGTSKWPRLSNSTGLATYSTRPNHSTKMSYAWAAPEVLDTKGTSFASDVYSFGVVVWEVLSRKLPWEDECLRNIFVRVVMKNEHLEIPADSPPDLSNVLKACWECVPTNRPTFQDIMISIG